jgi:hypothetical protein
MKKFFASAFVALTLVAFVACGNPGIKAAKKFIKNPTVENAEKMEAAVDKMSEEEQIEYAKWCLDHADDIEKAIEKAMD